LIYLGTAGFKYDDWRGPFYDPGIKDSDMLRAYARRFPAVELNFTYYEMPGLRAVQGIERKVPDRFMVCVKAHRSMTHERTGPRELDAACLGFKEVLGPLVDSGKLGCVLCQFPWSFKPSRESADRLMRLRSLFDPLPIVVEFRNDRWITARTFEFLEENEIGFCCVDQPRLRGLVPPVARATSSIGYVRFHGRNAQKWWKHEHAWERYDYLYTREELSGWLDGIAEVDSRADVTFAIFNNHYAGKAPANAEMLRDLLVGRGRAVAGIAPARGTSPEGEDR